jgi:MFS family permease
MKLLNGRFATIVVSLQRAIFYSSAISFYAVMVHSILHLPEVTAGLVIFSITSFSVFFQVIAGRLYDKGRGKETAVFGQIVQTFGLVLMGYSFLRLYILPSIFGFMLISIGGNSVQSSINAVVAESSTPILSRVRNFAKIRTAINVGFGLGPLITGVALSLINYGAFLVLLGISSLIFLFPIFTITWNNLQMDLMKPIMDNHTFTHLKLGYLLKILAASFLLSILFGQLTTSVPVYEKSINHLTNSEIGVLIGLNGAIIALIQYPISRLVEDALDLVWMMVGSVTYSVSIVLLSVASSFYNIIPIIILLTIGEAIFWATPQALITSISDQDKYGRNLGIFAFSISIGRGFGAVYGLFIVSTFHTCHFLTWLAIAAPGLISALIFLFLIKDKNGGK